MGLLGILLKKGGGIFILISDNPWIMGIGILILIITLVMRFTSSDNDDSNYEYEKPRVTKYTLCKACTKKKYDMKTGIYCGQTQRKPDFVGVCNQFEKA